MNRKMNIFLATDYSTKVMNAERYAFEFAKETNSTLTIVHVYEIPFNFPVESTEYIRESERLRKFELQKLKLHCETLAHTLGIKQNELNWECLILEGPVGKEIRNEAKRSHPDLIIMGTHNTSGFLGVFKENHTWELIKKATTPILSIPPDALLTVIKKIVFATEYRKGEITGLQFLVKLAEQFDAELTILHITSHTISKEFENAHLNQFKSDIQNIVSKTNINFKLVFSSDIAKGINDYCVVNNTDWLVMSHSKKFLIEKLFVPTKSITKELSLNSKTPVLAVPDFYVSKNKEEFDSISETLIFKRKDYTPG